MPIHCSRLTIAATLTASALAYTGIGCTQQPQETGQADAPPAQPAAGASEQEPATAEAEAERVRVVELAATDLAFDPATITAAPGERLMLRVVNRGRSPHSLELHLPDRELQLEEELKPEKSATLTFDAPQEPGTYVYYCPVGDHREKGMEGQLVVQSSGE